MATDEPQPSAEEKLLATLSDAQRSELEQRGAVAVGSSALWIEPGGELRQGELRKLYYLRTHRGVFRISKLDLALVEV